MAYTIRKWIRFKVRRNNHPDGFRPRSEHIDIRFHYVRKKVEKGYIKLNYVSTNDMIADNLTKAISKNKHRFCVQEIGLCWNLKLLIPIVFFKFLFYIIYRINYYYCEMKYIANKLCILDRAQINILNTKISECDHFSMSILNVTVQVVILYLPKIDFHKINKYFYQSYKNAD